MERVQSLKSSGRIVTFRVFDESEALAWLWAALVGFSTTAFLSLSSSPIPLVQIPLGPLAASLVALILSFSLAFFDSTFGTSKFLKGSLAVWTSFLLGVLIFPWELWNHPVAIRESIAPSPEAARLLFSIYALALSFVFQGPKRLFPLALFCALAVTAKSIGSDLGAGNFATLSKISVFENQSLLTLAASLFAAALIFSLRTALTDAQGIRNGIGQTHRNLEVMSRKVAQSQESVHLARERLWERTRPHNEVSVDFESSAEFDSDSGRSERLSVSVSYPELVQGVRKQFADFQAQGRAEGLISGPVRFVFFAPIEGTGTAGVGGENGRELRVHADLDSLKRGVNSILWLSLESLPETGQRRREGVIRLSVRSGLGSVEIAVEDNGRGIASPNPANENEYRSFKEAILKWSGRMERVSKLGVGSRTELELKLLVPRSRSAGAPRASADHQWRPIAPAQPSDQPSVG